MCVGHTVKDGMLHHAAFTVPHIALLYVLFGSPIAYHLHVMSCLFCFQGDLAEKAELQEALIKSEELRLQLAKTLISAQVKHTHTFPFQTS
jgi:hypothetical protein